MNTFHDNDLCLHKRELRLKHSLHFTHGKICSCFERFVYVALIYYDRVCTVLFLNTVSLSLIANSAGNNTIIKFIIIAIPY